MEDYDNPFDLYQNKPFLVRLWRCRHLLLVPFYALRLWLKYRKDPSKRRNSNYFFNICWSIERGLADIRMSRLYELSPSDIPPDLPDIKVNEKIMYDVRQATGRLLKPPRVKLNERVLRDVRKKCVPDAPYIPPPPLPKKYKK